MGVDFYQWDWRCFVQGKVTDTWFTLLILFKTYEDLLKEY